jgi:hypothetical protein
MHFYVGKNLFLQKAGATLGYMVSWRGINPNPEKVSATTKMAPPKSLHDMQK